MIQPFLGRFIVAGAAVAATALMLPPPLVGSGHETVIGSLSIPAHAKEKPAGTEAQEKRELPPVEDHSASVLVSEGRDASRHTVMSLVAGAATDQPGGLAFSVPALADSPTPRTVQVASPAEPEEIPAENNHSKQSDTSQNKTQNAPIARPLLTMASAASVAVDDTEQAEPESRAVLGGLRSLLAEISPSTKAPLPASSAEEETIPEEESEPPARQPIIGVAERVTVSNIGIDIAVQPGTYDTATGSWTVDDTAAFHADTTVPVNDTNGTTLIYGHAKWGIFGALPDAGPESEAIVYAADGMRFVYTFESVRQVDPTDVSMLTSEGPPKLVLQTCSGWLDQHRTLATFRLKEVVRG